MKIITDGFPKDEEVLLDEITMTYYQNPDCTESRDDDDGQTVTLSTRDGGGGKFIHVKTDGWSISDEKDLDFLINDFKERCGING